MPAGISIPARAPALSKANKIVRRNESSNDPFTIAQLYEYTQKGKSSLSQTLNRMEEKLDAIIGNQSRSVESADPEEIYTERSNRVLEERGTCYELPKDVPAFANGAGGIVLVGLSVL
jgi:hypothetical protein